MQTLMQQNHRLQQIMQKCEQQIMELKKIGQDHQQEIDNLLKFNQRLLSIIQNQMPNKVLSRTSSGTNLHPIDQTNQKQHQNITVPHRFASNNHPIRDKVEHLEKQQIQRLSQQQQDEQQQYKKHVNLPMIGIRNSNNSSNSPLDGKTSLDGYAKFRNVDSYETKLERPDLSSGRNSTQNYSDNVVYREEKESLIEIPKFFKLDRNLNDHYQKELFHSIQQYRPSRTNSNHQPANPQVNSNKTNTNPRTMTSPPSLPRISPHLRKQSIPSQSSQMHKISQAVTERLLLNQQDLKQEFQNIRQLIAEYKEDFDTQEYTHLCTIIRNDLENDLKELLAVNSQNLKFYVLKEKELNKLKTNIMQFSPVQKLVEIIRKLNISDETEKMILNKVAPNFNGNVGKNTVYGSIKK